MALSKSRGRAFIVLGAVQLVLALAIIVCSFVMYADIPSLLSSPVYAGFPYLLPGVLGIIAGAKRKNHYNRWSVFALMILNIVMSLFMYVVGVIMTIISVVYGPINTRSCTDTANNGCDCGSFFNLSVECSKVEGVGALATAVAILCYLCGALSLGVSILGCGSTCCGTCCPTSRDDEPSFTVAMAPLDKGVPGGSSSPDEPSELQ